VTTRKRSFFGIDDIAGRYKEVRDCTEKMCEPLVTEDYLIQSMPDSSPVKWHLAHASWFFETFVLSPCLSDYQPFHPEFNYLFNSYYNAIGPRWPRPQRGLLSRPTVADVFRYRRYVDEHMSSFLCGGRAKVGERELQTVVLGLNHEQQHQELILTDLKHAWSENPLHLVYQNAKPEVGQSPSFNWVPFEERLVWVGHDSDGFAFDNELPRHRTFLRGFRLASRLVTCGEFLEFMADGGYARPELWLSDGWTARQAMDWTAPLYWQTSNGDWQLFTLAGLRSLRLTEPVCHVSYYEADAFARWSGNRLPTEFEWEWAGSTIRFAGHFLEGGHFHPAASSSEDDCGPLFQLMGDVWQWTSSPYVGYPGYSPVAGALGEYNGKFMCNQMVLRGASCATPRSHARRTYRNFFAPAARWQFSGIRLARDLT
jgi:ergothioneine biosynthesis protein EgtB